MNYAQNFIQTIALTWYDAPNDLKIKIQDMIFPKGVSYDFSSISNYDLSLPFALNRQIVLSANISVTPTLNYLNRL